MPRAMLARGVLVVAVIACGLSALMVLAVRGGTPQAAPPALGTPVAAGSPTDGPPVAAVVGVADPVTVDVRLPGGEVIRVRALGIQPPGECYVEQGTAFARRILGTAAVRLVPDLAGPATDPFDRLLVHVELENADYAVLAAEAGVVTTYSAGASEATMPPIRAAERRAMDARRGMWAAPCPA